MKYQYTILPEPLHPIADLAISYFIKRRGVPAASISIEKPLNERLPLDYRPTFTGETTDCYILCVDVGESVYNNSLNAFVLDCINRSLPVKLFIAIPKGTKDPEYAKKFNEAKDRGVGVLQVDTHGAEVMLEAMPLSLAGVRRIPIQDFPAKLRENLNRAETIFRNGSPDKACSLVFDEIESICRAVGKKTHAGNCWNSAGATLNFKFETDPWAKLMVLLDDHLDRKKAKCPKLTKAFLARIHGMTPHRNESGHKPVNEEVLKKRDRELRTRFESAVDLLADLIVAVKPLRVI